MAMRRRDALRGLALGAGLAGGTLALGSRALAQSIAPPATRLVGLSLGVDAYQHLTPLQTAVADADAITAQLSGIGYAMEPVAPNPDTDAVLTGFSNFLDRLDGNTSAFLFMAGHGLLVDGRSYFLPANTPPLDTLDALEQATPIDQFLDDLSKAAPRQAIVVLDACRNNTGGKDLPGYAPGIATVSSRSGLFVLYSAGFGQFALDRLGPDDMATNGLFTRHFLTHISAERSIYAIASAARSKVIVDAESVNHRQNPAILDQSSRPYFLDGEERCEGECEVEQPSSLEGLGVVLAASGHYGCQIAPTGRALIDAERLHRALSELGANVIGLIDPSRQQVLDACDALTRQPYAQLAFVWLGEGQLIDRQVTAIIETINCEDIIGSKASGIAAELITHSDIIARLRPEQQAKSAPVAVETPADDNTPLPAAPTARAVPRPLTLIYDCGLAIGNAPPFSGVLNADVGVNDLPDGYMLPARYQDIAILAASSLGQAKQPLAGRVGGSLFVSALINALAKPELPLVDLARLVRDEVELATGNAQSPELIASRQTERRMFTKRREMAEAAGPPAPAAAPTAP